MPAVTWSWAAWPSSRPSQKILDKMTRFAAYTLGADPDGVAYADGVFTANGASITFGEVAARINRVLDRPPDMEMGLDESSFYQPTHLTFNYGTYVAVVEVDPETGDVDLQQLFCVDDQGVVVHPVIVEGASSRRRRAGYRPGAL